MNADGTLDVVELDVTVENLVAMFALNQSYAAHMSKTFPAAVASPGADVKKMGEDLVNIIEGSTRLGAVLEVMIEDVLALKQKNGNLQQLVLFTKEEWHYLNDLFMTPDFNKIQNTQGLTQAQLNSAQQMLVSTREALAAGVSRTIQAPAGMVASYKQSEQPTDLGDGAFAQFKTGLA